MRRKTPQKGFTLIEMMVAVALFAVVMLIAGSTLLSLVYANRKAQALQSVMNNLDISLDNMVRDMREGSAYDCGDSATGATADCSGGGTEFSFEPFGNKVGDATWIYSFVCPTGLSGGVCPSGGYIAKSENGGVSWVQLTAPEVDITSMEFYVVGTTQGSQQPKVVIVIKGEAGTKNAKTQTTFNIQATAVQRLLNL